MFEFAGAFSRAVIKNPIRGISGYRLVAGYPAILEKLDRRLIVIAALLIAV